MPKYNSKNKKSSVPTLPQGYAERLKGWHVGIDEAGRGCMAGPVTAAAVIVPPGFDFCAVPSLHGLTDSKKLSPARRAELRLAIMQSPLIWGIGQAWAPEIDKVNILNATFRAMSRATLAAFAKALRLNQFAAAANFTELPLFIDGPHAIPTPQWLAARKKPLLTAPPRQFTVIKGDSLVAAISAASILAKTQRDFVMNALHKRYPLYAFNQHKGYGTALHMQLLQQHGPCPQHRLSFGKKEEEQLSLF
ncbi:ribonuclease HII [Desulfovibrio sp. OttesenSCG-928-F07]|nr:ribonuclease HII [Desulfovibrio sp. OttesenSCG-928-F07]